MALTGDEPIRGFFKLQIAPPTRHGQVERQAWAFELPFPRLDDRAVTAVPDELRQPWQVPWRTVNTIINPHLRCMTIAPEYRFRDQYILPQPSEDEAYKWHIADVNFALGFPRAGIQTTAWYNLAGTFEPTVPGGYSDYMWLSTRTHSASLGGLCRARTWDTWHEEPTFSFMFYRWSPFLTRQPDTEFRPYVRLTVGQGDQHPDSGVICNMPLLMQPQDSLDYPTPRAQIFRAGSGVLLAEFDSPGQEALAADMSPRLEVLTFQSMGDGVYIVSLTGSDNPALIIDTTLKMEPATITVDFVASHGCFSFVPGIFRGEAEAEKLYPHGWPAWIGAENGELILRTTEPAGTSITTDLQEDNITSIDPEIIATTQPKLTFTTTDENYSAIVWSVVEKHPAAKGDPNTEFVDYSSWFDRWRVIERTDGRASVATFFPTDDEVDLPLLNGNEWAEVWLGHQWPDLSLAQDQALLTQVMSGPVSITQTRRDGDRRFGKSQTVLNVHTWVERFQDGRHPKKTMANYAGVSFQDWLIEDAVTYILDGAGVPADLVSFDSIEPAVLAELTLPNERPWERRYAYAFEVGIIEALNDLLAAVSLRFRITRAGVFECFFPQPYSGIPDHAITDSTGSHLDLLESIETDRRSKGLRNWVLHLGQDRDGNSVTGLSVDSASVYDPTSPRYIGDDWWSVVFDSGNPNAEVTAGVELTRRMRWQVVVRWNWLGHPDWQVGQTVEVDVGGIRLPRGSVVEILEKRSEGRADTLSYEETITAGLIASP